jgi:glycosidase
VELDVVLPDGPDWTLNAPGNRIRPDAPLSALSRPIGISSLTGLRGSPGVIALTAPGAGHTVLIWPNSLDELSTLSVGPAADGATITVDTGIAAAADADTDVRLSVARLGVQPGGWPAARAQLPGWYAGAGIRLPESHPAWTTHATIFEAQIGYSVFGPDRWTYAPYPTAQDLLADVDRIRALGFDTIQLMPRHPYPSYSVHDYADITTTYGEEPVIAELVRAAHTLGMRVILDVLMHGVIDQESIDGAAAGVRAGPYARRLAEATPEISGVDLLDRDAQAIAWSRHIIDFEPHWHDGSPARHRLCDEHPEWFCTDSAGHPTGIYTKAFDLTHPGWQNYFIDSVTELVRRLDIDGFRFDAPTYNSFASWSPRTRRRASAPTVASVQLFAALRTRLAQVKPDLMMYTEPSGPALRQSMDLNYNYDEQWLVPAVMTDAAVRETWLVANARDLAGWLAERDATLPPGAATAHHIDSHDTFWWPLPGHKWRREQYGLAATRALLSVFALCGGAFMSFVGGEQGVEEHLRRVNQLRRDRAEIRDGVADYGAVRVDSPDVFAVARRLPGRDPLLVLVNLSGRRIESAAVLTGWDMQHPLSDVFGDDAGAPIALAALGDRRVRLSVLMDPYQTRVLSPLPLESGRLTGPPEDQADRASG